MTALKEPTLKIPSALKGQFVCIEPLMIGHLPDLEKEFDPALFDFYPKPYTSARAFVEENLEMLAQGNYVPFVIRLRATGEVIGCTEFSGIDLKNRKLEIGGSWLRNSFHQTAANAEAKYLLLKYIFESLEFVRVQFTTNVLNRRSRAALEKVGAHFEGVLRNAMILPDGKLRDDAYYSIVAQEWPTIRPQIEIRVQRKMEQMKLSAPGNRLESVVESM